MTIHVTLMPQTLQIHRDKPHARANAVLFFDQVHPEAPVWFNAVLRRAIVQAKDGYFILATITELKERAQNNYWPFQNIDPDIDLVLSWTTPPSEHGRQCAAPTFTWVVAVDYLTNVLPTAPAREDAWVREEEEPLP